MQDLTPQLRTRLGRVERAVGIFVGLATLLLVAGICYYVYHTAQRKGWLDTKVRYYTYLRSGAGLKVGDPIKLMGFDAGEITQIKPMGPESGWNVFVEFTVRGRNIGYIWTEGSSVVLTSSGVFGSRFIEVKKGTNGFATFVFQPMRELPVNLIREKPERYVFGTNYFSGDRLIAEASATVRTNDFAVLATAGVKRVLVFDRQDREERSPRYFWYEAVFFNDGNHNYYIPIEGRQKSVPKVFLFANEPVPLNEVLDDVTKRVKDALPIVLAMTNQIKGILDTSHTMLSNVNELSSKLVPIVGQVSNTLVKLEPTIEHAGKITGNLTNAQGSLGQWLITADLQRQIDTTLAKAHATLESLTNAIASTTGIATNKLSIITDSATNTLAGVDITLGKARGFMDKADTNITSLVAELNKSLAKLDGITTNLHQQLGRNTNLVTEISSIIVHTDGLIEGLKRHWLLRSAFKTNAPPKAPVKSPAPPSRTQPGLPPRKD